LTLNTDADFAKNRIRSSYGSARVDADGIPASPIGGIIVWVTTIHFDPSPQLRDSLPPQAVMKHVSGRGLVNPSTTMPYWLRI